MQKQKLELVTSHTKDHNTNHCTIEGHKNTLLIRLLSWSWTNTDTKQGLEPMMFNTKAQHANQCTTESWDTNLLIRLLALWPTQETKWSGRGADWFPLSFQRTNYFPVGLMRATHTNTLVCIPGTAFSPQAEVLIWLFTFFCWNIENSSVRKHIIKVLWIINNNIYYILNTQLQLDSTTSSWRFDNARFTE